MRFRDLVEHLLSENINEFSDKVYYHGTANKTNFRRFKVGTDGVDDLGPGIYVTPDPDLAAWWARAEGGRIMPLRIRKGDYFDLNRFVDYSAHKGIFQELANRVAAFDPLPKPWGWPGTPRMSAKEIAADMYDRWQSSNDRARTTNYFLRAAGYIGAYDRDSQFGERQIVIFDPKNIRSVHAKYDPKKLDSDDLLA
jgi:hypothetical protein